MRSSFMSALSSHHNNTEYNTIIRHNSGTIQYGIPMNDFLLLIVAVISVKTPKSTPDSVNKILAPQRRRKYINTKFVST